MRVSGAEEKLKSEVGTGEFRIVQFESCCPFETSGFRQLPPGCLPNAKRETPNPERQPRTLNRGAR
jgi:hypothetical protein